MRVARVRVSAGKPGEFNADGKGYAPSGESEYSRVAAHGGGRDSRRRDPSAPRDRLNGFMGAHEKIRRTQIMIGTLEGQLKFERDPRERAKLEKSLRIKNSLLREYGREQNDPKYRREKIDV
jgi:hypothetical protein